jgi:hypothetical protein
VVLLSDFRDTVVLVFRCASEEGMIRIQGLFIYNGVQMGCIYYPSGTKPGASLARALAAGSDAACVWGTDFGEPHAF